MSDDTKKSQPDDEKPKSDWEVSGQLISEAAKIAICMLRKKYYPSLDQMDCEDIVADAVISVVKNLPKHDPSRRSLKSFVIDLAHKRAASHFAKLSRERDFLRQTRREAKSDALPAESSIRPLEDQRVVASEVPTSELAPPEAACLQERRKAVLMAVERLPPNLRETMDLLLSPKNPTYQEVAAKLNVDPKTISRRVIAAYTKMGYSLKRFEPGNH